MTFEIESLKDIIARKNPAFDVDYLICVDIYLDQFKNGHPKNHYDNIKNSTVEIIQEGLGR